MIFIAFLLSQFIFSEEPQVIRPDPDKVMKVISEIELDEKQYRDIYKELEKNLKKFDKEKKKYDKKVNEKNEIEKEIEEIKKNMIELNKNVTLIIKSYLNDEQLKKFNEIIKKQREKNISQTFEKGLDESKKQNESKVENKEEEKSPFSIYFP